MTTASAASRATVRTAQPRLDEHTVRVIRHARAVRRRRRAKRVLTRV